MSFFGLTSFGPENIIQSSLINSNAFTLFSEEEYFNAFSKLTANNNNKTILVSEIDKLMETTMGFKPLLDEINLFKHHISKNDNDVLSWDETHLALQSVKSYLNDQAKKSTRYISHEKYYYETYKHIRKDVSPNTTFKLPVSSNQLYGFHNFKERNLNGVRYPKVKCDETKFAEAIVLTGKQFMK
jgi:hypothetical protein